MPQLLLRQRLLPLPPGLLYLVQMLLAHSVLQARARSYVTQASSLTPSPAICKIVSYNELQMSCKATISNSTLHMNLNRLLSITYVDPLDTGTDRPLELGAGNFCGGGGYATFLYANTALRAVVKLSGRRRRP